MPQFVKRYVCGLCGAHLELDHRVIRTVLFNGSNLEPRWRVVTANGQELHRCGVESGDDSGAVDPMRVRSDS